MSIVDEATIDQLRQDLQEAEQQRDALIKLIASMYGWTNTTYEYAISNIAKAILGERKTYNITIRKFVEQISQINQLTVERNMALNDLERSLSAWEAAGMQGRDAQSAMFELARQRDEACAELDRLRKELSKLI